MTSPLLLASASPRRRRLLGLLGVEYDVGAVDVPEDIPPGHVDATGFASDLARDKALAAREALDSAPGKRPAVVLSADTIVVHKSRILGKPADVAEAVEMLRSLSGHTHEVVTAFAVLIDDRADPTVHAIVSQVQMRELDPETIGEWIAGAEVLGCAGAYNIESHLARVEATECFQNVAGLPLCHLYRSLAEIAPDLPGLSPPRVACEATLGIRCDLGRRLLPDAQGTPDT